jgi:hypothetical protein
VIRPSQKYTFSFEKMEIGYSRVDVRSFLKVICVPCRAYCSKTKNLEKIRRVILFILIHSFMREVAKKKAKPTHM